MESSRMFSVVVAEIVNAAQAAIKRGRSRPAPAGTIPLAPIPDCNDE
jgi:hypothetical protein